MHPAIVRLSQGFGCKVRLQMRGGSGGRTRIRRPPRAWLFRFNHIQKCLILVGPNDVAHFRFVNYSG
jgi:hypothetical protein